MCSSMFSLPFDNYFQYKTVHKFVFVVRWHERESQSKNLAASSKIASLDWRRWKPFSSLLTTMIMMIIICVYFRANYSFCLFPLNLIARWWDAFILNTRGRSRAKLPTRQTWEHQIIIHKKIINEKERTTNFLPLQNIHSIWTF